MHANSDSAAGCANEAAGLPDPPAGVAFLSPEEMEAAWCCIPAVPHPEGPGCTGFRIREYVSSRAERAGALAGAAALIPLCVLAAVRIRNAVSFADSIPVFPMAVITLLICWYLVKWLRLILRRTWIAADSETLRVRSRTLLTSSGQEFARRDAASVLFLFDSSGRQPEYVTGLRLDSGQTHALFRSTDRPAARYTALVLSRTWNLPVEHSTPLFIPGLEAPCPFPKDSGRELPARRRTAVIERAAAASGILPPKRFSVYDAEDPEFADLLRRAGIQLSPGETAASYAVRQSMRSVTAVIITLLITAGMTAWFFLDEGFLLRRPGRLFETPAFSGSDAVGNLLQLLFSAGTAVAFLSIPRWLASSRWYLFLPEALVTCTDWRGLRHRRCYDRHHSSGLQLTTSGSITRIYVTTAESKYLHPALESFSDPKACTWFAAAVQDWLGSRPWRTP